MHKEKRSAGPVNGAQSIRRAIALIRELAGADRQGVTASELAARSNIDRTTVHRILRCMAEEGMVSPAAGRGRYVLGQLAYEIGLAAGERLDLRSACRPALARIAAETGDAVFLMARAGHDAVCIDRLEGSYPVKTLVVNVGSRRPLGVGAGSLAILSALPPEEAEAAISQNADKLGNYPGVTAAGLRKLVAKARAARSASLAVTGIPGVHAVAVPVCTSAGQVVAALSVAAITSRMGKTRQAAILRVLRRESSILAPATGQGA